MEKRFRLTDEQREILKEVLQGGTLKVSSYAGTGKTTTLIECVRAVKPRRALVLAFNHSVKEELARKLPNNCAVYTLHGLAYKLLSRDLDLRRRLVDRSTFTDALYNLFEDEDFSKIVLMRNVFEAYCNSEFAKISESTVFRLLLSDYSLRNHALALSGEDLLVKGNSRKKLREMAGWLAERLEYIVYAISRGELPITHDYYLKAFQVRFDRYRNYFKQFHLLAVDEAQDVNGVQEFVLLNTPIPVKLAIGDKHQQIYSWRKAINTLARLRWKEKYLTTSFRFHNDDVVESVNDFLTKWKGEKKPLRAIKTGRKTGLKAIISRTNARLVEEIARLDCRIRFTRPLEEIFRTAREANKILDYLDTGDEYYLRTLPSYIKALVKEIAEKVGGRPEEVANFLDEIGEQEYAYALRLAMRYDIEALYRKAQRLNDPQATLVLSTAHSAKGLEFDEVYICDDFKDLEDVVAQRIRQRIDVRDEEHAHEIVRRIREFDEEFSDVIDEMDIYYVAFTRGLYVVKGEGARRMMESFARGFNGKTLWEKVKRKERAEEELWQAQVQSPSEQETDREDGWDEEEDELPF